MAPRIAAVCCLLLLAGCGGDGGGGEAKGAAPDWPAPPNPMELTREAGLVPERAEFLQSTCTRTSTSSSTASR